MPPGFGSEIRQIRRRVLSVHMMVILQPIHSSVVKTRQPLPKHPMALVTDTCGDAKSSFITDLLADFTQCMFSADMRVSGTNRIRTKTANQLEQIAGFVSRIAGMIRRMVRSINSARGKHCRRFRYNEYWWSLYPSSNRTRVSLCSGHWPTTKICPTQQAIAHFLLATNLIFGDSHRKKVLIYTMANLGITRIDYQQTTKRFTSWGV